jgi:hypothetical protein
MPWRVGLCEQPGKMRSCSPITSWYGLRAIVRQRDCGRHRDYCIIPIFGVPEIKRANLAIDNPRIGTPVATMNPGFAYVAETWQVAAEMIVPLNREGGNAPGFRAQLLFFIDDLLPSVFGKPLLTDQPNRSLIACVDPR